MAIDTLRDLNVLEDPRDLVVFGPSASGEDRYVFAVKPSLDFQKRAYDESIANADDSSVPAFGGYWKFDDSEGIMGSSTFLALRYDARVLRPKGLWIPGLLEAKALEGKGKLKNDVYRDYDLIVYSNDGLNDGIAQAIISQGSGLELPFIVPFKAMDYDINHEAKYGIDVSLLENPEGIISGGEAEQVIKGMDFRGNSSARRLDRNGVGGWDASFGSLAYSDDTGRADWICGEATQENLWNAYNYLMETNFDAKPD